MTEKRIRVRLDAGNTKAEIKSLNSEMKGLGSTSDKTSDSMRKLTSVAQAVASALAAAQIVKYADSWTTVNNRLNQATSSASEFVKAQKGVISIAQESATDLEGVASAYSRLAQATSELGLSQDQLLNVTSKLTLALKAGGATADETSSVMIQLAQGLGSGALQGDELRSILEASIPISKALAAEFGVNVGQLKTLGSQGLITADKVISAIENMDESALSFTKTFTDGLTNVNNSLTVYVGEINESLGATKLAGEALNSLANNIDVVGESVVVLATVFGAKLVGAIASGTVAYIANTKAAIANVAANNAPLKSNVELAKSELAKNIQIQAGAKRYLANAQGAYALSAATTALAKANGKVAASQAALTASTNALAVATTRATLVTRGATAAMALLGGPVGIAIIAAASIAYFATTMETASDRADEYKKKIKLVTEELKESEKAQGALNVALRESIKIDINKKIQSLKDQIKEQEQAQIDATRSTKEYSTGLQTATNKIEELNTKIGILKQSLFELDAETSKEDILKGLDIGEQNIGQANVSTGIDSTDAVNASLDAFFAAESKLQFDALGNAIAYNQKKFEALKSSLAIETQAIQEEAEVRAAFAAGEINQRQLDEELAIQNIFYNYQARREAILENEQLTFDQRTELLESLKQQELEAERLKQEELAGIKRQAVDNDLELEQQRSKSIESMRIANYRSGVNLLGQFVKQSSTFGKALIVIDKGLGIAETVVNTEVASIRALAELGPIAGPPAAAAIKTAGAISIATIAATGIGQLAASGGGSSGSIPTTSGGGFSSASSTIAPTAPTQSTQRVFNIELPDSGFVAVDTVSDILKSLAENNEDMQIAISKGQKQAARVGAI